MYIAVIQSIIQIEHHKPVKKLESRNARCTSGDHLQLSRDALCGRPL